MSAITLSSVRETVVAAAGAIVFSAMLVAAAIMPAQTALAATLGL